MKVLDRLKKKENLPLLLILLAAFLLRACRLGHESFWLDELHTMNEASPDVSFKQLFDWLASADQHPPLFFFCERFIFSVFGQSEISARLLPMLAGTISVYVMYLLGKEILNKNLGLIAAAFTCVNEFNMSYSREARGYMFAFLFAAVSLVFLIRLIKNLRARDMWYYSLFALLTMYSHYFGIFWVFSEFCVAFTLLFFTAQAHRITYLKRFALSGIIIAVGYLPWVPFVLKMSQIKSFWIAPVGQDFIFTFFNAYFGGSDFLKPVLAVLLIFYLFNVFRQGEQRLQPPTDNPLTLSFVIFAVTIVVTYTLPYIRSLEVVPMLFDRYTIVVLPAFLMAAAYGLELIADRLVKGVIFCIFVGWSLLYIFLTTRTYSIFHKTQFRELTAYISADPAKRNYPVVNDRVMWQEGYYLRKDKFTGTVFDGPRNATIDSLAHRTSDRYRADYFWLIDAHGAGDPANFLEPAARATLDSAYVLEEEQKWQDAWAQLYRSKSNHDLELTTGDFPPENVADVNGKVVAIWGGSVTSNAISLPPGNYTMRILAWGTPAKGVFPHLVVSANNKVVGDFYTKNDVQSQDVPLTHRDGDSVRITLTLDNDFADPQTHEDRNAFLKRIVFLKN